MQLNQELSSAAPPMKESADRIAAYLAEKIPQAGDFVIEQAPDVVKDVIALDLYRALGVSAIWMIVFFVALGIYRPLYRWANKYSDASEGSSYIPFAGLIAVLIISFIAVMANAYDAIGPAFAPKAHLLERIGVLK